MAVTLVLPRCVKENLWQQRFGAAIATRTNASPNLIRAGINSQRPFISNLIYDSNGVDCIGLFGNLGVGGVIKFHFPSVISLRGIHGGVG